MKKNTIKAIVAGTLAGVITVCSVPAVANGIDAVMNSVNVRLNGEEVATVGQNYQLQNGTKVPYTILYEGTTYLPIRKISELLDINIDWNNDSRTVIIDSNGVAPSMKNSYDSWYGAPDFGEFYKIKEIQNIPTVCSTTHWYEVDNVKSTTEYVEKLEEMGFERVTDGTVRPKFKVYRKGTTEVWLDLGMYTKLVYGVTVMDTTRPVTGREITYSGSREDIPTFSTAFGYSSNSIDGVSYTNGDFHLWSCLPGYFSLLEEEGFSVSRVDNGFYGKEYTLKKDRSSVFIKFDLANKSDIPAVAIDY